MNKFKGIVKIAVTIFVIIIVGVAIAKMQSRQCKEISIRVEGGEASNWVTKDDVMDLLDKANISVINKEYKEVNAEMGNISNTVNKHPYVSSCDKIYLTGKTLVIKITSRNPLIHVFSAKGEQYFIDYTGDVLPYSSRVNENLIVANGNIQAVYAENFKIDSSPVLYSLYNIAKLIEQSPFHAAQFRQMYVNGSGEIELIPTVGNQYVLFGNHKDAQDKLAHIEEMYTQTFPYTGMDQYASLDVRYKNRVIARKK